MSIEKLEEFAKDGDKNLDNLDVNQGFLQSEKPERQWFNKLLYDITKKINSTIDFVESIEDGFFDSVDSARTKTPPLNISSMITRSYSDNGKGGAKYARSDLSTVSQYPNQAWFQTADGAYWLLDEAVPTPEMFGAKGDLKWQLVKKGDMAGVNADTCGPRMLSGTNDIEAFNAAMKYAKIRGCEKVLAAGSYYIRSFNRQGADGSKKTFSVDFKYDNASDIVVHAYDSTGAGADDQHKIYLESEYQVVGNTVVLNVAPLAGVIVEVCQVFTVFGNLEVSGTLWTHYALPSQGIYSKESGSRYTAKLTIGQYSYNGSKPSNNGQYGVILCVGSGFLLPVDHVEVHNIKIKSEIIRAARVVNDTANNLEFQDSDPSQMCIGIGRIRNVIFEVDPFDAATNVASLMLCLFHWGGRYTPPGGAEIPDKGAYPIEKTWHPESCQLTTSKVMKAADHGFFKGFELASTINCTISDFECDGLTHPYWVGVGDIGGAYAQGEQVGRVNTGNRIGYVTGYNINVGTEIYAVLFKGEGTSKFEKYTGTDKFLQRQGDMDLTVKGHTIYCNSGDEVIRMRGVRGRVDMGVCRLYGCPRSFYILSGTGNWVADIAGSDGVVRIQNQKGGTLLRTNIDLGNSRNNTVSDLYAKGYEAKNCTVYLQGSTYTTTTTAAIAVGATSIPITAFSSTLAAVSPNDLLKIKSGTDIIEVRATGYVAPGGLDIPCTPVPKALGTGAAVTLDLSVEMDYINMTSKSSEYGLYSENAVIKRLDFSQMGWSGRHSARMYNTRATIIGRLPSSDSRRISTASDQAIWADSKCRLIGLNLEIPSGSDGDEAVFLQAESGNGATLTLVGGVVGNVNTLSPSAAYPINQINFSGTVDNDGQILKPIGRSGTNANGSWVKYLDGSMECWARNVTIGATQPYTWTFPVSFSDTASIYVNATATSMTTSRVGAAISTSITQATITISDNTATTSGSPSSSVAGMSLYAKGFWR
jgi:hypothetical protein